MLDSNFAYQNHHVFSDGLEVREYILRYDHIFADEVPSTMSASLEKAW